VGVRFEYTHGYLYGAFQALAYALRAYGSLTARYSVGIRGRFWYDEMTVDKAFH
jgi:hypothetical protein